jgi:tungstate transport system substrate-binding protein
VMYNKVVILGPSNDPAHIRGLKGLTIALARIAGAGTLFASRGDDSGTARAEIRLWNLVLSKPVVGEPWYHPVGQGMGETLNFCAAMNAYTLTDRATWANFKNRRALAILTEGDPALLNTYSSILINPAKWPLVNYSEARIWHEWITSKSGLDAITSYKINGEQLFFPPRKEPTSDEIALAQVPSRGQIFH